MIKITINHELRIFSDSLFLIFISYLFFYYYLNIATIFEVLTDVTKTGNGERGYARAEQKNETWQKSRELEIKSLGSLSNDDGDGTERQRTTTLHVHHAIFHISLPSSHDYDMKLPNFTLCGGREHMTTTLFSFSEL